MIEIFSILFQFFLFFFLLSFNIFAVNIKNYKTYGFNFFSKNISFNIIIFLNFILIASFLNIGLNKIIYIYLIYVSAIALISIIKFKSYFYFNENYFFNTLLLFISSIIIFFEIANNLVLGWDTQRVWVYKTLSFYNGFSIDNLSNLPNPFYPYLGSLSWAFFWKISISDHEYFGRLFYVFCFLVSLLLIINNLKIKNFYKIIFFVFLIIISYDYTYFIDWGIFSGYQEILIFCLVANASYFFYELHKNNNDKANFYIFSILLICNLLVWIKLEGYVISLSLIFGLLFFCKIDIRKKFLIIFSYLLILLTRVFIFDFYNLNPSEFQHLGYKEFSLVGIFDKISLDRIFILVKFLLIDIFANYLVILSLIILILYLIKNKISKLEFKMIMFFLFLMSFNITIFSGIFIVTDLDLTWMLKYGLDRIIYQISPISFYLLMAYVNHLRLSRLS
ncbi:hypothetical protein OA315_00660 [Candidatus Pelagibacter sp.]|nr:hypothetical protein [Candidatus Pelagibacter sp.]